MNRLMRYFEYAHLPENLQAISRPFCELAREIDEREANDPAEQTVALRKLLESKDAAVRAMLPTNFAEELRDRAAERDR